MKQVLIALVSGSFLLAGAAEAAPIVPAGQQVWLTYVNDRFGARAEVPTLGFVAAPVPANNDGRTWTGTPEVEIAVYGNYWSALADDFAGYRTDVRVFLARDLAQVTYEPAQKDWFVFSGYLADGRIFYDKMLTLPDCDIAANLHIAYPESEREMMDGIVSRLARTLALDAAACGDEPRSD